MEEAQMSPINRCFGSNCQNQERQKQERIKDILSEAVQRKRAKKELDVLLLQFHGRKSILQLLPVIQRRCLPATLTLAIERVERKQNDLSIQDRVFFEEFKSSLKQKE